MQTKANSRSAEQDRAGGRARDLVPSFSRSYFAAAIDRLAQQSTTLSFLLLVLNMENHFAVYPATVPRRRVQPGSLRRPCFQFPHLLEVTSRPARSVTGHDPGSGRVHGRHPSRRGSLRSGPFDGRLRLPLSQGAATTASLASTSLLRPTAGIATSD